MINPVVIFLNVFFPISEFHHFPMKTSMFRMGISQHKAARCADSSPPGADVARRWQCLGFAEQSQRVTGVLVSLSLTRIRMLRCGCYTWMVLDDMGVLAKSSRYIMRYLGDYHNCNSLEVVVAFLALPN